MKQSMKWIKIKVKDDIIELVDNENLFHLIKVLRVKQYQKVKFIDSDKNVYLAEIIEVFKNFLKAKVIKKTISNRVLENKNIFILVYFKNIPLLFNEVKQIYYYILQLDDSHKSIKTYWLFPENFILRNSHSDKVVFNLVR